jgi:hypothetical protein
MQRNFHVVLLVILMKASTVMRKAPKLRYYSMTASDDFRLHVLLDKKIYEGYTQEMAKVINLFPGEHQIRHISRAQKVLCKKKLLMKTPPFKTRPVELKHSNWFTSVKRKYRR